MLYKEKLCSLWGKILFLFTLQYFCLNLCVCGFHPEKLSLHDAYTSSLLGRPQKNVIFVVRVWRVRAIVCFWNLLNLNWWKGINYSTGSLKPWRSRPSSLRKIFTVLGERKEGKGSITERNSLPSPLAPTH